MAVLLLIFMISCPICSALMLFKIKQISKSYNDLQNDIKYIKDNVGSISDGRTEQKKQMDSVEVSFK